MLKMIEQNHLCHVISNAHIKTTENFSSISNKYTRISCLLGNALCNGNILGIQLKLIINVNMQFPNHMKFFQINWACSVCLRNAYTLGILVNNGNLEISSPYFEVIIYNQETNASLSRFSCIWKWVINWKVRKWLFSRYQLKMCSNHMW